MKLKNCIGKHENSSQYTTCSIKEGTQTGIMLKGLREAGGMISVEDCVLVKKNSLYK